MNQLGGKSHKAEIVGRLLSRRPRAVAPDKKKCYQFDREVRIMYTSCKVQYFLANRSETNPASNEDLHLMSSA
jgi:hypothetical protein